MFRSDTTTHKLATLAALEHKHSVTLVDHLLVAFNTEHVNSYCLTLGKSALISKPRCWGSTDILAS